MLDRLAPINCWLISWLLLTPGDCCILGEIVGDAAAPPSRLLRLLAMAELRLGMIEGVGVVLGVEFLDDLLTLWWWWLWLWWLWWWWWFEEDLWLVLPRPLLWPSGLVSLAESVALRLPC